MSTNSTAGSGVVAGLGCLILTGWLAFWGTVLFGLIYLVFVLMPTWAS